MGFLLVIIIALAGWLLAKVQPRLAQALACQAAILLIEMELLAVASGIVRHFDDSWIALHKPVGHWLTILVWIAFPFAIGVLLRNTSHRKWWQVTRDIIVILAAVGVIIVSGISGYLGPFDDPMQIETYHRFLVYHGGILPIATFLLLLGWVWALWPTAN